MSVIIRLQGLSWSASAMDIRNFFNGLSIPPGGVRIIGGDNGDAFIAFSTDEDARQAMMLSNKPLNDSPVQLFLSSKTEMQNTITQAKDKTPNVSAPDATSINNPQALISPQIPSVQQISRAFPAVGQIMGTLGIQPSQSMQINQLESGVPSNIASSTLQQPSCIFDYVNNQQRNIQTNVGKQIENDFPGEYSIGGIQGLNKQSDIKATTIGQSGLVGNKETSLHKNEFGQAANSVQNNFNNPRPQDNFHGEVYYPPNIDIPFNNQSKNSSGHGRSFQNDHSNLNRNFGGHGKQFPISQQFGDFSSNDNRFGHPHFPPFNPNTQTGNKNIHGGNTPNDLYFPPGNRPNEPYIPPSSSVLRNQIGHVSESRFSQGNADNQLNADSSVRLNSQKFPLSSSQGNSALSATNRPYDPNISKSNITDKPGLASLPRKSRFTPANVTGNHPVDSLSQPMDQSASSSHVGSVESNLSVKENKIAQSKSLNSSKATGGIVLSNKQDEFGRNLPYADLDSSRSPTQDGRYEGSRVRDKRTGSRERDRSRDRSSRRDSPRDRRDRDRDRSRRDRDDDRRSKRDRDRDYDRKTRDSDRYERNRDRDPKRSPSLGSSRRSRKRSLSPNDNNKNEKEKKLQTEKPDKETKQQPENIGHRNDEDQKVTVTKSERTSMTTNFDSSSKIDSEQKNSNSLQALFPVIPASKTGKGILGEAPAGLTTFRDNVQRGGPLLETPTDTGINDSRRDEFGFGEDGRNRGMRDIDRFVGRGRDEYDRSFTNEPDYRDPYYSENRNRRPEEFRHPGFVDRNQQDMQKQSNPNGSFMRRDREHPFENRRRENRGPDSDFHANKGRFQPFHDRNQDMQGRPSLLGDGGGTQHEIREHQGPDSEFRRSRNEMPSLFDDVQNQRRHNFQGRGRGVHSHRGGHENVFRNDPAIDHSHEIYDRENENNFNHPRENDPNLYESGHHGPPSVMEPFIGHNVNDEHFNPELSDMRNNRQPFRGRGFRGHRFQNMPYNMRGANIGPPRHREFQGDGDRGHMPERRSRFSNFEEPPFDVERDDFDGRERYDNRASDRYQQRTGMEERSNERVRNERNIERSGFRNEKDQSTFGNRSRDLKERSNEPSDELKLNVKNQNENNDSIPRDENIDNKTSSESEKELVKGNALCSVVLENIPVETTYKDIRKLFTGLELPKDGIKIMNNNEGRRIGKAFVRFGSQDSFKKGLQKDRSRLGNKIIIIKPVPRKEFDTAVDSYLPPEDEDEAALDIDMCNSLSATLRALKGEPELKIQKKSSSSQNDFVAKITLLPEYAKIQNIKTYFKDEFEIAKNTEAIVIESSRFKACTGLCYVEFADENSFSKALKLKRMFERKVIKIEKGSKKEMDELRERMKNNVTLDKDTSQVSENAKNSSKEVPKKSESASDSKSTSASNSEQSKSSIKVSPACICLRVRNVPKSLKVFELRSLFEGVGVNVKVAQICHDAVGRAIGEAYLEFSTNVDAQKCLVKNGTYINKNKIIVEAVTKPEMIENMRLLRQSLQPELPTTQAVFFFVKAENLPKTVSTGEIMNFFSGYNPAPESIRLNISENKDQPNCSTALVGFRSREQAETAISATDGNLLRNQSVKLTKIMV